MVRLLHFGSLAAILSVKFFDKTPGGGTADTIALFTAGS
jgi:hypothetical protein